mmetsp:Transcript_17227/g.30210  ORF Transcript_17227/g.30210 Transcript_17227/m.30210 type:complete len:217 (-) Transcript_17227:593-1243(-)
MQILRIFLLALVRMASAEIFEARGCEESIEDDFWLLTDLVPLVLGACAAFCCKRIRHALSEHGRLPSRHEWTDAFGCTALHYAAQVNSSFEARRLLDQGSNANARDAWEETPLHVAARSGEIDTSKVLLLFGADVNAANFDGKTPLLLAAENGHQILCEFLLDRGASAGGLEDKAVPALLSSILLQRMIGCPTSDSEKRLPVLLTSRSPADSAKLS